MHQFRSIVVSFLTAGLLIGGSFGLAAQPVSAAPDRPTVIAQKKNESQKDKAQDTKGENIDPVSENQVKSTSVVEYISDAYRWLAVFGGLLAVIMLMYAGYSYMSSHGDPEKVANAKDIVEKALIGLGLLILAAVILKTINPATIDPNSNPNRGNIDFTKPGGGPQKK